ncbi:GumC family protein [Roseiconus lacunae]|uniref:GumC family protein n=1 Tax=Roseiconus lacunae TaxID=2605694 RepID=UPI001E2D63F5|nr:exopolysaccharide biosynthesis protein [Roseiconus lacunae]MCD0463427.1 exopolysaccharide biosynthesis protein [Roseiconus lacunae]
MNSNVVDPSDGRNGQHLGFHERHEARAVSVQGEEGEFWASVTPSDLLQNALRHWPSILLVTLFVASITVALLIVWPNRYGSDGMLYVRLGRAAVSVDPTAQNAGAGVSIQETRSAEIQSVAQMIASREIAERAVEQIGVETILQPRSWVDRLFDKVDALSSGTAPASESKLPLDEATAQLRREVAIKRVRKWLHIDVPKNGYAIAVSIIGPDPFLAQAITQSVMDHYKNFHVEAHRSDGSLEFFKQQVAESRDLATKTRETLQRARSDAGWTSIESAETTLRERIIALEVALDATEGEFAEARQRRDSLQTLLASTEEWIPTEVTRGMANAASDSMKTQLFDQQVDESEQLATLRPEHPRFRLLQEKMARSQNIVADEAKERELRREALNPLWQQLESELSLANAKADGLAKKSESLESRLAMAKESLLQLNQDAVDLARLKWEADIAEETLLEHSRSLEEARFVSELDRNNMSDVTVIQDASLNLKKVSPSRALLAIVGVMLGFALGLFQALLRHPIRSATHRSITSYPHNSVPPRPHSASELWHDSGDIRGETEPSDRSMAEPVPALPR